MESWTLFLRNFSQFSFENLIKTVNRFQGRTMLERLVRRINRSVLKKIAYRAGIPKNSDLLQCLDGLWVEPIYEERPKKVKIYTSDGILVTTHPLEELYASKEDSVFIIGSGPSIKNQPIAELAERKTILLNGAIKLIKDYNLSPLCVVISDDSFIRKRSEMLQYINKRVNFVLTFPVLKEIFFSRPKILQDNNIFLIHEVNDPFKDTPSTHQKNLFLFDKPTWGTFRGGTVMSIAIQIAAFFKVKKTYLLGLDIGNSKTEPRFYETTKNVVRSGLLDDYKNTILPFMKLAAEWFHRNSCEIFNCSPVTKLPYSVIPYADIEKIVGIHK